MVIIPKLNQNKRMNVHLFGAGSSPGCANFGLKQTATDHERESLILMQRNSSIGISMLMMDSSLFLQNVRQLI